MSNSCINVVIRPLYASRYTPVGHHTTADFLNSALLEIRKQLFARCLATFLLWYYVNLPDSHSSKLPYRNQTRWHKSDSLRNYAYPVYYYTKYCDIPPWSTAENLLYTFYTRSILILLRIAICFLNFLKKKKFHTFI